MKIKRIAIVVGLAVFVVSAILIGVNRLRAKSQYNLILISVDTLRADHMGVYGYHKNTTPNIDKWAKDAFVFTKAYTIMPITLQSFYTLFTGRNDLFQEDRLRVSYARLENMEGRVDTLPSILQRNNFLTAAFITNPVLGNLNSFFTKGFSGFNFIDESELVGESGKSFKYDYQSAKVLTEKVKDWIATNYKSRFFLWIHYSTPHMPYNPPKEYICKIDRECNLEEYKNLLEEEKPYDKVLKKCDDLEVSKDKPKDIANFAEDLYDAEILSVDDQIGEVLKSLRKLKLEKKTIVIFYGDHGENFDRNIFGHENSLYESTIRIPLIIKPPPYKRAGKVISRFIDNPDILPTILTLLNIPYDSNRLSGENFASSFDFSKKDSFSQKIYLYFLTTIDRSNKFAITDGTYKYIYSKGNICLYKNMHEELYNLKTDPHEMTSLIREKPQIASRLKKALLDYLAQYNLPEFVRKEKSREIPEEQRDVVEKLKSLGY